MKNMPTKKLLNILAGIVLPIEICLAIFLITGSQYNIYSATLIIGFLIIYIEFIICLIFKKSYSFVIVISLIIDIILLSLYVLIVGYAKFAFLKLIVLAVAILLLNRPVNIIILKVTSVIKFIYNFIKPDSKISFYLSRFGAILTIVMGMFGVAVWSYGINRDYPEGVLEQICIHEAGHAVISELLFPGEVKEVVWNPRVTFEFMKSMGIKNYPLGYTSGGPDMVFQSPSLIKGNIQVLLAGELSTIHFFHEQHIAGGGSDIPKAYELAQKYFKKTYSKELGTIYSLGNDPAQINQVTKSLIDNQYDETMALIERNEDLIKLVADKLKTQKRLTGEELRNIIDNYYIARKPLLIR